MKFYIPFYSDRAAPKAQVLAFVQKLKSHGFPEGSVKETDDGMVIETANTALIVKMSSELEEKVVQGEPEEQPGAPVEAKQQKEKSVETEQLCYGDLVLATVMRKAGRDEENYWNCSAVTVEKNLDGLPAQLVISDQEREEENAIIEKVFPKDHQFNLNVPPKPTEVDLDSKKKQFELLREHIKKAWEDKGYKEQHALEAKIERSLLHIQGRYTASHRIKPALVRLLGTVLRKQKKDPHVQGMFEQLVNIDFKTYAQEAKMVMINLVLWSLQHDAQGFFKTLPTIIGFLNQDENVWLRNCLFPGKPNHKKIGSDDLKSLFIEVLGKAEVEDNVSQFFVLAEKRWVHGALFDQCKGQQRPRVLDLWKEKLQPFLRSNNFLTVDEIRAVFAPSKAQLAVDKDIRIVTESATESKEEQLTSSDSMRLSKPA